MTARPVLSVHHKHIAKKPTSVFVSDGRTVSKATLGKLLREGWRTHVSSSNNTDFRMVRLVTIMKKEKNTEEQEG